MAVWIYGFSKGLHSAREIERQMRYEPGLRWLTGLNVINHHTLSDFRAGRGEALRELFEQVLAMLTMKGLLTLERVTVDGTKIRADTGKKSFTKRDKIETHLALAREHLDELERQENDEHATQRQKAARRRAAREREQRLEEALAEIERLRRRPKRYKDKEPQASTSDPEAAFMRMHDGGLALVYNVQVAVDGAHGLIADVEVANDPQDGQQIVPAMERLKQRWGNYPPQALADGAYTNLSTVLEMHERSIDYYSNWTGRNAKATGRGASSGMKIISATSLGLMRPLPRLPLSAAAWKAKCFTASCGPQKLQPSLRQPFSPASIHGAYLRVRPCFGPLGRRASNGNRVPLAETA